MNTEEMTTFVKTVADVDRLRIIGFLIQHPSALSEISKGTGLNPSDTHHHLERLKQAGIVLQMTRLYQLENKGLENLARNQLEGERLTYVPDADLENDRRRVLAAYLNPDGSLKTIPLQPAKRQVILEYLLEAFATGANYTEKEVNLILRRFHPDAASLRRYLIDADMLERKRDGSRYWRPK